MRFNEECLKNFGVGRKLFGGRFIRFMSGMKNETDLLLERDQAFNPQNARVNFACPEEIMLRLINPIGDELPDTYKPGFLKPMINFKAKRADPQNSYVLMLDGKKIKRGADVDLFGSETGQTLKQRQDERDKGLNILKETVAVVSRVQLNSDSIPDTTKDDKATVFNHLVSLMLFLSVVLRGLRKIRVKKQCGLIR